MSDIETRNARALKYLKEKAEEKRDRILFILTVILATPLLLTLTLILLSVALGWQL
jgi:hypothetical protein